MDHLEEQAARRAEARTKKANEKVAKSEEMKSTGNEKFRRGNYIEAAQDYVEAINCCGPTAVLLCNLAAAYFKLNCFEQSHWATTTALEYDPTYVKARFRRAMARKQLKFYDAAVKDLEVVITQQPDNKEAQQELKTIRNVLRDDRGLSLSAAERDHPRIENGSWEAYMESDSEDSGHSGNSTPCRFYNHAGCSRGSQCQFSHAPDDNSIRDELGKNVCLELLLGTCKFGETKCIYSHDKGFLPPTGWWNDPAKIQATRKMRNGSEGIFDKRTLIKNPLVSGYTARKRHEMVMKQLNEYHDAIKKEIPATVPSKAPSQERFVLVLSFEYDDLVKSIHSHLLTSLRSKIKVVEVSTSIEAALRHLVMPNLASVLVADPAIAKSRKYAPVLTKLVEYVKNGGSVALAGQFSSHISPPDFDKFIEKSFGLDWKFGAYHRTTFKLNPTNELVKRNPSLVSSYSMKTVHVADITPEMAIYVPMEGARLQSLVFPADLIKDTSESPAVCARVGRGLLSFLGDVNGENASTNVTLAMLGLLDTPNLAMDPSPPGASASSHPQDSSNGTQGGQSGSSSKKKGKKKKGSKSQTQPQSSTSETADGRTGSALIRNDNGKISVASDFIRGPRSEWGEQTGYAVVSDEDNSDDDDLAEATGSASGVKKEPVVVRSGYAVVSEEATVRSPGLPERVASGFILIVSLADVDMFMRTHIKQIDALKEKMEVKTALTTSQVLAHLKSPDIRGVYIADEGIARPTNSRALSEIVDYIKAGGQLVIGGLFPSMSTPPNITKVLSSFGVPWRAGSYSRTEASRNNHHETSIRNPSLPEAFFMKAVHLTGFHAEDLFYEQYPQNTDDWEAPILRTRLGNGHLGYIGDVNAEPECTDIVLAMLELLTPKRTIVADSKKFFMILTSFNDDKQSMDRFLTEFIEDAKKKAEVLIGLSNARIVDLLPSRDLLGILITDPYILDVENEYLLSKVVEYSKQGGTVVFGSVFSRQVTLTQFRPLFRDNWGLDWDFSIGPQDTVVTKNAKNPLVKRLDQLKAPKSFQISGIYVRGITAPMAVYIPQNRQNLWKPSDNTFRSSIIYTDVEKGHLGFIGVSIMDDTIRTIFYSMIGLM